MCEGLERIPGDCGLYGDDILHLERCQVPDHIWWFWRAARRPLFVQAWQSVGRSHHVVRKRSSRGRLANRHDGKAVALLLHRCSPRHRCADSLIYPAHLRDLWAQCTVVDAEYHPANYDLSVLDLVYIQRDYLIERRKQKVLLIRRKNALCIRLNSTFNANGRLPDSLLQRRLLPHLDQTRLPRL